MVEGERDSVRIQSPLMQINANAVCLVRTQFQQLRLDSVVDWNSIQSDRTLFVRFNSDRDT
jgi:hypothetical protein